MLLPVDKTKEDARKICLHKLAMDMVPMITYQQSDTLTLRVANTRHCGMRNLLIDFGQPDIAAVSIDVTQNHARDFPGPQKALSLLSVFVTMRCLKAYGLVAPETTATSCAQRGELVAKMYESGIIGHTPLLHAMLDALYLPCHCTKNQWSSTRQMASQLFMPGSVYTVFGKDLVDIGRPTVAIHSTVASRVEHRDMVHRLLSWLNEFIDHTVDPSFDMFQWDIELARRLVFVTPAPASE